MATIRARYEKGVLTPLEPLEFEDGDEVIVAVERTVPNGTVGDNPSGSTDDAPDYSKGFPGLVERIEKLRESFPPDMWDDVPTDLAKNKKHYLYGHPKEED